VEPPELQQAVDAGKHVAAEQGLRADDAVLLHNSNRIAVRLLPCDSLARVAPLAYQSPDDDFELVVGLRLAAVDSPVAEPDPRVPPRVYVHDGFAVTLWTYYEPVPSRIGPDDYANALAQLHGGLRQLDLQTPHFTDRVDEALTIVGDPQLSPDLGADDRELLGDSLRRMCAVITGHELDEQLLHGEPHLGNVLPTRKGYRFIDLETCCRGPVEFDIAHGVFTHEGHRLRVEDVCEHYPGADAAVVEECRVLIWAMITSWRWRHDDQLPNREHWRVEGLSQLERALS
jgi:hypothetical protein